VRFHGLDPARDLIELSPRPGEDLLRTEDVLAALAREGHRIATVVLPGLQYLTGQVLDVRAITRAARDAGCAVGWDLAHAIGNVPLELHDAGADFAVWCHYKYVNGGPGAVGGAFVHERHARDPSLPRLAGWWGNDLTTRFRMAQEFEPAPGASGWQVSTPPVLAMAPIAASLELFDQVVDEMVRLGEQVPGIDQDDRERWQLARHHVQRHGRLRAEARRQRMLARQVRDNPAHAFRGAHALEFAISLVHDGRLVHCQARIPCQRSHSYQSCAAHAAWAPTRPARQAKSPKHSPSMRSLA
jgi:selenocysteine lyase/cysteine desulfurase